MSYKAIIFDLDGTLIDSMTIWKEVDLEYLEKRNIPVSPELFTDLPEGNSFSELAEYVKNKFHLPDSLDTICSEWTGMVKEHYEHKIKLRPGVQDLLEFLKKKGVIMAIGTSNSLELTSLVLKQNGVYDYFEVIISGDTHLRGKPFPDIFIEASEALKILPSQCLVIEDTLVGIRSAKAAGMQVMAIEEPESKDDWTKIQQEADYCLQNFAEIQNCLQGIMR